MSNHGNTTFTTKSQKTCRRNKHPNVGTFVITFCAHRNNDAVLPQPSHAHQLQQGCFMFALAMWRFNQFCVWTCLWIQTLPYSEKSCTKTALLDPIGGSGHNSAGRKHHLRRVALEAQPSASIQLSSEPSLSSASAF